MKDTLGLEFREYEILSKHEIAASTFLFRLKGEIGFVPGQFVQVGVPHFGEITVALCSDPKAKGYFEVCIRRAGSTSNALDALIVGDKMQIRGPYGNGWPIKKMLDKDVILIGGGMGMVPLRPVIYYLLRNKIDFGKVSFFGGFRNPHSIIFEDELLADRKNFSQFEVVTELTERNFWGKKGLVTEPLEKAKYNPRKSIVLMCGPEIMYKFCAEVLKKKGFSGEQIFISFERRMTCGIGICQHCNIGKFLVCKDGPVFSLDEIETEIGK